MDPAGGTSYTLMGTSQLLSVPYALYSENTENVDDADADPANEIQTLTLVGDSLTISGGNTVTLQSDGGLPAGNLSNTLYHDGTSWQSDSTLTNTGTNVGIGTSDPSESAILELSSLTKGFLPPIMTTAEMNAISNPAEGLNIYNIDVKAMCYYDGNAWNCMDVISLREKAFICGNVFIDYRDNKSYSTFQIGKQCWIAENLAYLPSVSPSSAGSEATPYYYVYGYQGTDVAAAEVTSNYQTYGVLYNWPAAMAGQASSNNVPSGVQGVCPVDWHLPSDEEWKILEGEVDSQYGYPDPEWDGTDGRGTDAGGNLKEAGTTHWASPNTGATNSSGFTALPGGFRSTSGSFSSIGLSTNFRTSTDDNGTSYSWGRFLNKDFDEVSRISRNKAYGFYVRCLKDCPYPTQAEAGSDSLSIQGTSTTLNGNTPSEGTGVWTVITGNGGSFADSSNPATIFTGFYDNTYTLLWTIRNTCGSTNDTVMIGFVYFNCGTITDNRDGNTYNTVIIGSQCWMKENLAYLPSVSSSSNGSSTTPFYYVYDHQGSSVSAAKATSNYQSYGVLYNWPAAMAGQASSNNVPVQGVCPTGWHIPGDEEWKILEGEVDSQYGYPDSEWNGIGWRGTDAGGNLKEIEYTHWNSPNTGATNSSGFTALAGGYREYGGYFYSIGDNAYFWSSAQSYSYNAWYRKLNYNNGDVYRKHFAMENGYSVRCLKDCSPWPDQADAGSDSLIVQDTSTNLNGNTPSAGTGLWTIISGNGGSFADSTNPTTMFYGLPANTYILLWTISNSCGSSSDTVMIGFYHNCGIITDSRDGNTYNTVSICTQRWMKENLAYLPSVSPSSAGSEITPYYYVYDYEGTDVNAAKATSNYQTYGVLYNWPAAMAGSGSSNSVPSGVQGICPNGWHLPGDEEWKVLEGEVDGTYGYPDPEWDGTGWRGTDAGGNLKEIGYTHWSSPNAGATNSSGFTALAGGYRDYNGFFDSNGYSAHFWSSAQYYSNRAWNRYLYYNIDLVYRYNNYKESGFSVRCLKD